MADNQRKIIKARNERSDVYGPMMIWVVYEGDTEETYLRDFFDDEIWVEPDRLIGKTEEEARKYIYELDVAYLRS